MSRKDFVLIANALRASHAPDEVVREVARALSTTNPNFDFARFVAACKQTS